MNDDFFSGVDQVVAGMAGRKVPLPVFYRDARSFTLVMPANLFALRRMMPDRRFVPAQIVPGVGAVHLTAFEYLDTDIDSYNELALGVMLNSPLFLKIPGYNMLRQLLGNSFYTYIHRMPVNAQLALRGGVDLYNYPKFMADIGFEEDEEWVTCTVAEGDDLVCRVRGRKIAAPGSAVVQYFCGLYQFKQPQEAEFKVNALRFGMARGPGNAELVVGRTHPVGRELAGMLLSATPLIYIYQPSLQAILYGPEHLSLASISMFLEQGYGISLDELSALIERDKKGAARQGARKKAAKPAKRASAKKAAGKKAARPEKKAAGKKAAGESAGGRGGGGAR